MKKVLAIMIAAVLFSAIFSGMTVFAGRDTNGVRMETEREGGILRLKVIANEDINLGGIGFTTVPTCDTTVFSFKRVVTRTGLDIEQPASASNYLYVDTTNNVTVPVNEVIFTVEYDIIGEIVAGTEYEFVGVVEEAFDYYWEDYDWVGMTVTGVYSEEPSVPGEGVRMETERDGDILKLKVIANEDINLGGIGFSTVPTCDTTVFSFKRVVPMTGLDIEQPASASNYLYVDTTNDVTVPTDEVIFTVEYDIVGIIVPGTTYEFVGVVEEAFDYYWEDYDWVGMTVTGEYTEPEGPALPVAPTVSFSGCSIRERTESDSADSMRVTFDVTFNDSYITYVDASYGAVDDTSYQITALSITLTRTDSESPIEHTVACTKIFRMVDDGTETPHFLYNVTLTGIDDSHYEWQFAAYATVTYSLGAESSTASCDPAEFTLNDVLAN